MLLMSEMLKLWRLAKALRDQLRRAGARPDAAAAPATQPTPAQEQWPDAVAERRRWWRARVDAYQRMYSPAPARWHQLGF